MRGYGVKENKVAAMALLMVSANDVPISTISRGIEIDLRQNLGESLEDIPKPFPVIYDTQK